jgi:hypothetical protein
MGRDPADAGAARAFEALDRAGYINASFSLGFALGFALPFHIEATEKGLQQCAGWPTGAGSQAFAAEFVAALTARIDDAETPEDERGRLQRLRDATEDVGLRLFAEVVARVAERGGLSPARTGQSGRVDDPAVIQVRKSRIDHVGGAGPGLVAGASLSLAIARGVTMRASQRHGRAGGGGRHTDAEPFEIGSACSTVHVARLHSSHDVTPLRLPVRVCRQQRRRAHQIGPRMDHDRQAAIRIAAWPRAHPAASLIPLPGFEPGFPP